MILNNTIRSTKTMPDPIIVSYIIIGIVFAVSAYIWIREGL